MKTRCVLAAAALALLGFACVWGAEKEDEETGSFWMQKKLEYSEKILAGLARD